ncbi:hypothetical protein CFK41_12400 [Brachybacterium ginsengisoli]|uniref:Integral membrane protein n=1 Tax=Brachybacterium ginsengisoli TaxID=1331682 RepID=A0A291GZ39_9MICO|nr:hypothetical protein [Brachybacterium ginsengisoli]ATG55481.1 hypothetical protein CFK41_12400 [Brachybacterium ginsengisoli]
MSFLLSLLVVLHLICWAVALGTWVAAARTRQPNPGMPHAVAGAVVTGLVLAALVSIVGDPNHMKLGVKLLIGVVALVLAYIAKKKGPETTSAVWFGIPTAIVLNVIIAVFV